MSEELLVPAAGGGSGCPVPLSQFDARRVYGLNRAEYTVVRFVVNPRGGLRPGADYTIDAIPLQKANRAARRALPRLDRRLRPVERHATAVEKRTAARREVLDRPIQAADGQVYTPEQAAELAGDLGRRIDAEQAVGATHHGFGSPWLRPLAWGLAAGVEVPVGFLAWSRQLNAADTLGLLAAAGMAVVIPIGALFFASTAGTAANQAREADASQLPDGYAKASAARRRMVRAAAGAAVAALIAACVIAMRVVDVIGGSINSAHLGVLALAGAATAVVSPVMEFIYARDRGSTTSRAKVDLDAQLGLRQKAAAGHAHAAARNAQHGQDQLAKWVSGPRNQARQRVAHELAAAHRTRRAAHFMAGLPVPDGPAEQLALPTGAPDLTGLTTIDARAGHLADRLNTA